jgi:tetratricopeptide (TPR) repeat protein
MQSVASPPRPVGATTRRVNTDGLLAALLLAALVGLGAVGSSLETTLRPPADRAQNGAAWEGRRLLAQMLWLKTHAVIHAGVEERSARENEVVTAENAAHPEEEAEAHAGHTSEAHSSLAGHEHESAEEHAAHAHEGEDADQKGHAEHAAHAHARELSDGDGHDEHDGHGHGAEVLVIPSAASDFRGILGDLERATKPYIGANGNRFEKDADQTVPFYRLTTWADPHFIQGYVVGATFICRMGKHLPPAIEFLKEGERNNPDSFEIQTELGHLLLVYGKDYPAAERHLRQAVRLLPQGRKLTESESDARSDAYRWLALTYREWNRPAEAMRVAREGLAVLGPDPSLNGILEHHGKRLEAVPGH